MFQQLLVAIDGSDSSLRAGDTAIELAALLQARLHILSVEETPPSYVATHEESRRAHSATIAYYDQLQAPIHQRAVRRGVHTKSVVLSGHEGQTILDYIKQQHCDLLVLGHQGHSGVWGAFLGSTADKLVNHAPCSVLVTRSKRSHLLFKRMLIALDGSPLGWQAFQVGLQMAKSLGASLRAISVVEGPVTPPAGSSSAMVAATVSAGIHWNWPAYFQEVQTLAAAQAHLAGMTVEMITREGHASGVLTASAREENSDLLILGATGNAHPWSSTTGGTARRVANEAPCAVLLVRQFASKQRVRDLMATEVPTITQQAPVAEVVDQLIERGVKLLVVVNDEQRVLGVITLGQLFTQNNTFRRLDLQLATSTEHLGEYVRQFFTTEKTAGDAMHRRPLVVRDDTAIEAAAQWMISQHVTRVPVVNAEEKLVGMLDQASLLHYYTDLPEASDRVPVGEDVQPVAHPRTVGEAVLFQVPLVPSATPLFEVLRQVQETPLRRVIVVDSDGHAVGVIADRDILASRGLMTRRNPIVALAGRFSLSIPEEIFRRRSSSGPLTAQQVMRPRLFTVTSSTSVTEAVRIMLAHQIKRLVVVDEAGKPLGLVDRQHLLRPLVEGGASPG
ncbi:MAG: hypothetical protein NVSMB27_28540 [Ktedonobacteraceae bacterium]